MELTGSCHCGAVRWTYEHNGEKPLMATACNCTVCRRYGTLWIYDRDAERVELTGDTKAYLRSDSADLQFDFCPTCGCVVAWRATPRALHPDGSRAIAVNSRMCDDPQKVADLPIRHFDGFDTFKSLPQDERCVKDLWF
mmetsp:Transcript_19096/g.58868  ORF Transcript_19096/g.58868 Transcript_19096/m.58868 type:complete len:139 (+) Transcript_19096:164-580(+)